MKPPPIDLCIRRLHDIYDSQADFAAYDQNYKLTVRLRYASATNAWLANPLVYSTVNPTDYQRVTDREALHFVVFANFKDEVADPYTVVFTGIGKQQNCRYYAVAMGPTPFHPQGFCQHCDCVLPNPNIGRRLPLTRLPLDCATVIRQELQSIAEALKIAPSVVKSASACLPK